MTYAAVVAPLTRALLEPLRAFAGETPPAALVVLYRPLGAALLYRMAAGEALHVERYDPRAIAAARTMLEAWLVASVNDTTPLPVECGALTAEDAGRRALRVFLGRHWPALR